MSAQPVRAESAPHYAELDASGALIAASRAFGDDEDASVAIRSYLDRFVEIGGEGSPVRRPDAAARWRASDAVLEARTAEGEWRLLTSHPTAAGGRCLVSIDITAIKAGGRLARAMMENHPLPVWANDAETGEIVFHNQRTRELFDLEEGDARVWRIGDFFVTPGDSRQVLDELKARGRIENHAMRARSAKGREFWISGAATLVESEGRAIALAAIQDVTTLKEHERESRRSLDLLSDALRSLPIGLALFDEDARLVLCNDMFRDINAGVGEFIAPGVHWETLVRETAGRRLARHAAGRESAWVNDVLGLSDGFKSFEIERTDGAQIAVSVRPTSLGGFIVTEADISDRKAAERLARDSEEMLSKILEASPANLCMSRIGDGEVIYQSPSCAATFGADASAKDQFADRGDRADFLTELLPAGRVDNHPALARGADGGAFPALFSARVVDLKGEEVMVSAVTDLTEQQKAQRALEEAGTRLRDAIEALDEGFADFDAEGRLRLWNRRYAELNAPLAGRIREGASCAELAEAMAAAGAVDREQLEDMLRTGPDRERRARLDVGFADGTWRTVSRYPTSEGGFVVTVVDITERKRAEAAERAADEVMRCVLETCPISVTMANFESDEVVFRGGAADELHGRRDRAVEYWADLAERRGFRESLARTGRVDDMQVRLRRADGSEAPALLSARLIEFRGEPMIVTFAFDLTERAALEAELEKQRELLHQSEKLSALGELLAGVAHELNNPLSVVVGHALMLQEEARDETFRRRADKIGVAAERCARIVKTFLAMARQRPAKLERVDVNGVVETALDVAGHGLRASGAAVILNLEESLPAVSADADQLAQVFANLIVNAEHALAGMGAEAILSIETKASAGRDEIVITVADNGPGIPRALRARIFEPFFTTKAVGQGTGLGLALCHRIIEAHHGRITVDEAPGGGARFAIRLAALADAVGRRDDSPEADAAVRGRALVVDDEPDVADLIAQVLTSDGFDVQTAASAEEALDLLPRGFDLILSDLSMPGLGGRAFLSKLRETWPILEARLGFITGDTMSPGVGEFLRSAGRPYLEKPAVPSDIRRLANELSRHLLEETSNGAA